MRHLHWAVVIAAIVLFGARPATADPITIAKDLRITNAHAHPDFVVTPNSRDDTATASDVLTSSANASSGASSGAAAATLLSSFADPMHLFGSGTANVAWTAPDRAQYTAASQFGLMFDIASPVSYAFNGTFSAASSLVPSDSGVVRARTFAVLGNGSERLIDFSTPFGFGPNDSTASRTFAGLLSPGHYFLSVASDVGGLTSHGPTADGSANAAFTFRLDFTPAGPNGGPSPTPEPASLLLLGTGIAGVFGRSYRSRKSND